MTFQNILNQAGQTFNWLWGKAVHGISMQHAVALLDHHIAYENSNKRLMTLYEEFGIFRTDSDFPAKEGIVSFKEISLNPEASAVGVQELVVDIRVEVLVQLPNDSQTDREVALESISATFHNADIGWRMKSAESWFDDDIIWIDLTVRITGMSIMDAEASCMNKLKNVEKELLRSGYRLADKTCSIIGT